MTELKNCPMCGSTAKLDADGATECYGYAWQNFYIDCQDDFNKKCSMGLTLEADFCMLPRNDYSKLLTALWNQLGVPENE